MDTEGTEDTVTEAPAQEISQETAPEQAPPASKSGSKGARRGSGGATPRPRPRLKERYLVEYRGGLKDELGLENVMQVPRMEKIVLARDEEAPVPVHVLLPTGRLSMPKARARNMREK